MVRCSPGCFDVLLTLHFLTSHLAYFHAGELPSKLETLTAMASELAVSAVNNGRFHHATASLALEEQLATRGNSILNRSFKSRPIKRSASSAVVSRASSLGGGSIFSAFTDELSKVDSAYSEEFCDSTCASRQNSSQCPPGMVHTSQSDNSTADIDDADACSFASEVPSEDGGAGEWAAALVAVADQSMDKDTFLGKQQRDRSISESSQSSGDSDGSSSTESSSDLCKSPVGFWYVRPGSSSIENDSSEDDGEEPICWTPSLSSSCANPDSLLNGDDGPSCILPPSGFSTSNLGKLLTEATEFDESSHPSNADDEFGPITPEQGVLPTTVGCLSSMHPTKKTLSRSISYSAFSTSNNGHAPNTDFKSKFTQSTTKGMGTIRTSTQENDLFRTYFVKFVDLLVARETERLIHSKEPHA